MEILPGQRWASRSEPELGLGLVTGSDGGRVRLKFPASGEKRVYASPGAPLVRVRFAVGDQLEWLGWREAQGQGGGGGSEGVSGEGRVEGIREENGRLIYQVAGRGIPESALSGLLMRRGPLERLELGQPDANEDFELRREALFRRAHWQKSPLRGFEGARMDLIPHQLGIASEAAERLRPRVLLADEVGLGKTIEACLILHRLHLTGRADRVLIAVPEPLVHQWFVELLRRFNLRFSIFDEERCGAIEDGPENSNTNPFTDSQLVLCGLDLLTGSAGRTDQAVSAGWDLLIVDEAHRLTAPASGRVSGLGGTESGTGTGSREKESLGNQGQEEPAGITPMEAVRRLAETVPAVLLLSGTPQQAGWQGHYALLHLLDPERYPTAEAFLAETGQYSAIAGVIERMDAAGMVDAASLPPEVRSWPETQAALAGEDGAVPALRAALLDRCGIGGVMFRHVRSALGGFPERAVHPVPLPDATEETRVRWLADWLRRRDAGDKVLLICRSSMVAERLREALLREIQVKAGVFHEELTLLQRDRQAAWFAEEDGADILLCSEIGGEGRNFQFARHLVLWDLPEDPDVLEQRVGRLDRIGRRGTIHIHVPFATGTAEDAVLRWLTEGLGLLHAPVSGAQRMAEETAALRRGVLESPVFDPDRLRHLILATREVKDRISRELAAGGDRLLQWQADTGKGQALAAQLKEADSIPAWEKWCIRLLESLGTQVEELRPRHWRLEAGSAESESLPEMPVEGISAVFDRAGALVREDAVFMTPDHPLPRGAIDLLLGSERGTAACATAVPASGGQDRPRLLLEVCYVLECVARPALHAARFLPSLPLRVVVDEKGADLSADQSLLRLQTTDAAPSILSTLLSAVRQYALPEKAAVLAAPRRDTAIAGALKKMNRVLEADLTRLAVLRQRRSLPPEEGMEIAELRAHQAELKEAISQARLRMDAIRLLVLKPR
ncbi:MAG: SNF2-related protein [Verrucomicrobiales bacterium]|nr:SNF2-related protein [Verrucomicrobiales bacterium]